METKGVTCKIPLELHDRISEEIRASGSTMGKFIEMVINSYYEEKEKGVKIMGNQRTMAFQVSEELFQKIKEYLAEYERTYHRRLTQKEFVIGLIEQALEEAKEEFEAVRAAQGETAELDDEPEDTGDSDEDEDEPDATEDTDEDEDEPDEAGDADEDGTEPDEAEEADEGEDEPNETEDGDEDENDPEH